MELEHKKYEMKGTPLSAITLENICGTDGIAPASYWAPRREEIQRFVDIAKTVHTGEGKPRVLDVGCGTGFLAYLLAETGGVNVIGLDPQESLISGSTYSHPDLRLEVGDSRDAVERYSGQDFDLVISSWMPYQLNLTPNIRDIGAKVIVYIKEAGGATGVPHYEYKEFTYDEGFSEWDDDAEGHREPNPVTLENGISYHPGENYQRAFEWSGPAASEVQDIARRLSGERVFGFGDVDYNLIDIQFRKDVPIPDDIPRTPVSDSQKYQWETGLEQVKGLPEPMRRHEEFSW
jgi:SAM-dependent methyltransferase